MHFFRSEEHLRNWEGFQEKNKEGMISLDSLMQLFSRPYFTNRRNPDYFSNMGKYLTDMVATLDTLKDSGDFWKMGRLEKIGVSVGEKLGVI